MTLYYTKEDYTTLHNVMQHYTTLYEAIRYYAMLIRLYDINYRRLYNTIRHYTIIDVVFNKREVVFYQSKSRVRSK